MNKQIPHGWNRWRIWFSGGIDDYGWRYSSVEIRLSPMHGRTWRVQWGWGPA